MLTYLSLLSIFCLGVWGSSQPPTCRVENVSQIKRSSLDSTFIDSYTSSKRDQHIQFSSHITPGEQELGLTTYEEMQSMWRWFNKKDKREFSDYIKWILDRQSSQIAKLRKDISKLREQNDAQPYAYIGIESPPSEMDGWSDMLEMGIETQNSMHEKLKGYLTRQEIDDFLLFVLGDELYLRLPGKPLADLPVYSTESDFLHHQHGENLDNCITLGDLSYQTVESDYVAEKIELFFEQLDQMDNPYDLADYHHIKEKFLKDTKRFRESDSDLDTLLSDLLNTCQELTDTARDEFLAKHMTTSLPEGRGLIFRGTLHRDALKSSFLSRCNGDMIPPKKESTTDEGVE